MVRTPTVRLGPPGLLRHYAIGLDFSLVLARSLKLLHKRTRGCCSADAQSNSFPSYPSQRFLYADDIVLISPSIIGLKQMLVVCSAAAKLLAFIFNDNKRHCLSLGKLVYVDIGPMLFDNRSTACNNTIKYLRVHLLICKCLSFDIIPINYAACNNIFSLSRCADEIIQLSLQEIYCLPVLLYASPALYRSLSNDRSRKL